MVSIEAVKIVRDTEMNAEQLKKDAVKNAKKIVFDSQTQAETLLSEKKEEAQTQAQALIAKTGEKARLEADSILESAKADYDKLKNDTAEKIEKAADIIYNKVVRGFDS